jgi:signal peptidase I
MCEVRQIKAHTLFPLIMELIEKGQSAKISVSGTSMLPLLRNEIDSVELSKGCFDNIKRGDIVMAKRLDGAYVMHRVIKKNEDSFFIVGDAQQWIEGPLKPEQLVAVVKTIWRENQKISCDNLFWRFLSGLWLLIRPHRHFLFKVYGRARSIRNKITKGRVYNK